MCSHIITAAWDFSSNMAAPIAGDGIPCDDFLGFQVLAQVGFESVFCGEGIYWLPDFMSYDWRLFDCCLVIGTCLSAFKDKNRTCVGCYSFCPSHCWVEKYSWSHQFVISENVLWSYLPDPPCVLSSHWKLLVCVWTIGRGWWCCVGYRDNCYSFRYFHF